MDFNSTMECIICYTDFDDTIRKPCIGTCGHSICEYCKGQMTTSKCPHCNKEEAFAVTTINYQVLEMMKAIKEAQKNPAIVVKSKKNFEEGICSVCESTAKKLRICVECGIQQGILIKDKNEVSLNLENTQVDDAVFKARNIAICGDCALDGEHSSHKIMAFVELKKNLEDVQEKTVTLKLEKTREENENIIAELEELFRYIISTTRVYLALGKNLSMENEKKVHYNNVDIVNEQTNQSVEMLKDVRKRLTIIRADIENQKKYVEENSKAFSKKAFIFASDDPTLIADRKQSVKDPLLIGVFNPKDKGWTSVGRMPTPKSNYAVAALKNRIYIVGGMNGGQWLKSLEMYDRDRNLRKDGANMKHGRTRTSAGFHNSKLYVAGGYDGTYMSSVEVYNPETNEWKDAPNLTRPRADCGIVSCNGDLYILGGYNGKEYEEKIEKLNEETNQFEVVGDMNGSRAGFGACVFKGRIYIAGGWSSSNNTLKTVKSYDPMAQTWRDELSMTRDRKYFTLHGTHEAVYAIRGCADSWTQITEVERLNTEKGQWEVYSCVAQISGNPTPHPGVN